MIAATAMLSWILLPLPTTMAPRNHRPRLRSLLSRLLVLVTGFASGLFAAAPAEETVVDLPPFIITEARGNPWRYGQVPGFEILSQCNDQVTQAVVDALVRGRQLVLPPSLLPNLAVPTTVILFNQAPERASSAMAALGVKRGENEEVIHWTSVIKRTTADSELFCLNLWKSRFRYSTTFRFDLHTLLALSTPPPPDWLREGLFGRYGTIREGIEAHPGNAPATIFPQKTAAAPSAFDPQKPAKSVVRARWFASAESKQATALFDQVTARARQGKPVDDLVKQADAFQSWLPSMAALLEDAPPSAGPDRDRWASAASLFVRWGMFEHGPAGAARFWRFAERSCTEPATESLFRECLGLDYATARNALARYLPVALSSSARTNMEALRPSPDVTLHAATNTEIARVRGNWERVEAALLIKRFPEIGEKYRAQAGRTLRHAYDAGSRDPRLLASLGLLELESGNHTLARELLEQAAAGDVVRPQAYLELARLRFAAFVPTAGATTRLDPAQTAAVLHPLAIARKQTPASVEVYRLMADTLARSSTPPSPDDRAALIEGTRIFPRDTAYAASVSRAFTAHGRATDAAAIVERALLFATDDAARAELNNSITR